jgi:hypothetical protein
MNRKPDETAEVRVSESVRNWLADKAISILCGFAALILGSVVFPLTTIVFSQYEPLAGPSGFLMRYWEFCVAIFVTTVITLGLMLWKHPALGWGLHGAICAIALVVSGTMRLEKGLPSVVWIQFLLYFGGIVIACEMALAAFGLAMWRAFRLIQGKPRA